MMKKDQKVFSDVRVPSIEYRLAQEQADTRVVS